MAINIKDIAKIVIRGEHAIKFPLRCDSNWISDANGNHILDVRGWGYLQYHDEGPDRAAQIQDDIGQWVVETLNAEWERVYKKQT